MKEPYIQANRNLWNSWTKLHTESSSEYDDLLTQLRAGQTTLSEIELEELGDVSGNSLLHLQCHFGLDTLSWAREGAIVTGVDFSDESIAQARRLSQELDINADFICSDVYELPMVLDQKFDIIFTSKGVLPWLPDLGRWAEIIVHYLKPGGTFYIRDDHPVRHILLPPRLDATGTPIEHGYVHRTVPTRVEERGSYAATESDDVHTAYYWTHGLGEIVTVLSSAGLRIEFLHEFVKVAENCHSYEETELGRYELRLWHNVAIPRMFSIRATFK